MKFTLRNREPGFALICGALIGLATGITFALCIILDEGGGSLTRGWDPGMGYLSFYGIFMLPILAIVALGTMGLSRLLGGGIVTLVSIIGLGGLLIPNVLTSCPGAQLARVTGRSAVPDLEFERFEKGHTFSDGTSYLWVARCSPDDATQLAIALGLERIPTMVRMDAKFPMSVEHQAVRDYQGIFEGDIEGIEFFADHRGMIGGFSPSEQRFRLYWWPAALAPKTNG